MIDLLIQFGEEHVVAMAVLFTIGLIEVPMLTIALLITITVLA